MLITDHVKGVSYDGRLLIIGFGFDIAKCQSDHLINKVSFLLNCILESVTPFYLFFFFF